MGGDEGEGGANLDQISFVHPHPRIDYGAGLILPPAFAEAALRRQALKREDTIGEISNIFD